MKKFSRVLAGAAVALAFSVSMNAAPVICNAASCPVAPTATYLTAYGPFTFGPPIGFTQDGTGPVLVDLQALGYTTGSIVTITGFGDLNINASQVVTPKFGAVFSSTTSFNNDSLAANRVTNALAAPGGTTAANPTDYVGTGSVTPNGGVNNDISQDFLIFQGSGTTFTLPNIAIYRYLFIGILDNLYADNSDGGAVPNDLMITFNVVPEPATYMLFLSGLGALVAFRRYRRN